MFKKFVIVKKRILKLRRYWDLKVCIIIWQLYVSESYDNYLEMTHIFSNNWIANERKWTKIYVENFFDDADSNGDGKVHVSVYEPVKVVLLINN